jgi:hypothetical protein
MQRRGTPSVADRPFIGPRREQRLHDRSATALAGHVQRRVRSRCASWPSRRSPWRAAGSVACDASPWHRRPVQRGHPIALRPIHVTPLGQQRPHRATIATHGRIRDRGDGSGGRRRNARRHREVQRQAGGRRQRSTPEAPAPAPPRYAATARFDLVSSFTSIVSGRALRQPTPQPVRGMGVPRNASSQNVNSPC